MFEVWILSFEHILSHSSGASLNSALLVFSLSGQGRGGAQGRPRGGGRGGGFGRGRGQGRGHGEKISAEDLDAELEKYHSEAMQIN
ncbi:RNA-binding (RRM/RBD/RNP motifs) family protein [Actinidia rufa]|uniref:RNA-binding (RRM/RBD/RNP motifs) family protein n=1 Tax=Actinidia rufa TaxID=165716 RepID=A0A7J0DKY4_9ERIC|nr:RNA-binding (RRM/RBD/RNP motifs) family protein [Actinidia rufa]